MAMPVNDRMAKARAAIKSGKKTEQWQIDALFAEFKVNGGNLSAAAKKVQLTEATARYYFKKAADPKYASSKNISPDISERSWVKRSGFDIDLNRLIQSALTQIETQLKTAGASETVKTLRELMGLKRYIETMPSKVTKIRKAEDAQTPEPEEDVAALLVRAAARKAKEKSRPLGDTTPDAPTTEAPIEEASAEM